MEAAYREPVEGKGLLAVLEQVAGDLSVRTGLRAIVGPAGVNPREPALTLLPGAVTVHPGPDRGTPRRAVTVEIGVTLELEASGVGELFIAEALQAGLKASAALAETYSVADFTSAGGGMATGPTVTVEMNQETDGGFVPASNDEGRDGFTYTMGWTGRIVFPYSVLYDRETRLYHFPGYLFEVRLQ